jgi:hypothetical protein
MYITNMLHFLDEKGNIHAEMPREARELAAFLALVVDTSTGMISHEYNATGIRCFEEGCIENVVVRLSDGRDEIEWLCPECHNEGRISHWQGTRWANSATIKKR